MQLHHWFAVALALTPSLASAALFPKDTLVKQIDAREFKKVMKENVRALLTSPFHSTQREPTAQIATLFPRRL